MVMANLTAMLNAFEEANGNIYHDNDKGSIDVKKFQRKAFLIAGFDKPEPIIEFEDVINADYPPVEISGWHYRAAQMIIKGDSNKEIARKLSINKNTILKIKKDYHLVEKSVIFFELGENDELIMNCKFDSTTSMYRKLRSDGIALKGMSSFYSQADQNDGWILLDGKKVGYILALRKIRQIQVG